MARRHAHFQDEEDEPEFQISTMCDVLMCLLIFFVATATKEVMVQTAEVKLPDASHAQEKGDNQGQITVNVMTIMGKHTIEMDQQRFESSKDIVGLIKASKKASDELRGFDPMRSEFRVLIRADKEVPYQVIKDVMKSCGEAGVINVVFATNDPKQGQKN